MIDRRQIQIIMLTVAARLWLPAASVKTSLIFRTDATFSQLYGTMRSRARLQRHRREFDAGELRRSRRHHGLLPGHGRQISAGSMPRGCWDKV